MTDVSTSSSNENLLSAPPMAEAAAPVAQPAVEQDTADSEDILNLHDFLMPATDILLACEQFGLQYNKRLFNGWVKQPSPCCGASAVAGAYNALRNVHRCETIAATHLDVLKVYVNIFEDMIEKKKRAFERRLGCASFDTLLIEIRAQMESARQVDIQLSAVGNCKRKKSGITKKHLVNALRTLALRYLEAKVSFDSSTLASSAPASSAGETSAQPLSVVSLEETPLTVKLPSAIELMIDLMVSSGIALDSGGDPGIGNGGASTDLPASNDASESEDSENGDEAETASKAVRMRVPSIWNWQKDLVGLLKNVGGLERLTAQPKPSTAPIGNWALIEAVQKMADYSGVGSEGFSARLFMGKKLSAKQRIDFPLSRKDTDATITSQWDGLRSAFSRQDTALIFHLTNHFAMIFATREWLEPLPLSDSAGGTDQQTTGPESYKVVRQILTARRGQRPTVWIDFTEVREIMLGWEGYKIMAISRGIGEKALRDSKLTL